MEVKESRRPNHLAWHETLELHELVAFQSFGLMKLKKFISEVKDPELHKIYVHTIKGLETNLNELLRFYSIAARDDEELDRKTDSTFSLEIYWLLRKAL